MISHCLPRCASKPCFVLLGGGVSRLELVSTGKLLTALLVPALVVLAACMPPRLLSRLGAILAPMPWRASDW
eukprot:2748228-Amphidinium_carterae.1